MRIESSATTITWIPSEAVTGAPKLPFALGLTHYDPPPPDVLQGRSITDALRVLRDADGFRFANHLDAWIEVEHGEVAGYGHGGGGMIGATTLSVGRGVTVAAVPYPELRSPPEVGAGFVRFRQTAGGRTGIPAPRRVKRPPFVQIAAPTAWTTVELTIHTDGHADARLVGASPFPRHWLYDHTGSLTCKSGLIDFGNWYRRAFGTHTPWGDEDACVVAADVESALERQLSQVIMRGARPRMRTIEERSALVEQGDAGAELFLVLDGLLSVHFDGEPLAEIGPGALIGERALLEGGRRTASLVAVTRCKVAVVHGSDLSRDALVQVTARHRREASR